MGDSAAFVVPKLEKRFKTELTDYSRRHEDSTGPYADNLDVDAIIVGAGFSECFSWVLLFCPISELMRRLPLQVGFSC